MFWRNFLSDYEVRSEALRFRDRSNFSACDSLSNNFSLLPQKTRQRTRQTSWRYMNSFSQRKEQKHTEVLYNSRQYRDSGCTSSTKKREKYWHYILTDCNFCRRVHFLNNISPNYTHTFKVVDTFLSWFYQVSPGEWSSSHIIQCHMTAEADTSSFDS